MGRFFRLGDWQVRPDLGRITGPMGDIHLQPKAIQLLLCLARAAPEVVTKEVLFREVWPNAIVTDEALTYVIWELRKALGDDAKKPRFIQTIPKKGYRLVAAPRFEEPTASRLRQREGRPARRRAWILLPAAFGLVLGAGFARWFWSGEPRPVVSFRDRKWLLVADFENATGDAAFASSLEYALEVELTKSGVAKVVPRERVRETLRLMKRPLDSRIDIPLATEVALRDGEIRAIVTGRIDTSRSSVRVSLRVIDPATGATVSTQSRRGRTREEVLLALQGASTWVGDASEALADDDGSVPLQRVTTRSLEALQLYSQAMPFADDDHWAPVADLLERAVADDPDFASAHIFLAHAYSNLRNTEEAGPHYEKAFGLVDDLSEPERYFILGSYYARYALDDEKAAQAFEILTAISPDSYWARHKLSNAYQRLGRYQEATTYRLKAADLHPESFWDNLAATLYLHRYGGGRATETLYYRRARTLATDAIATEAPWSVAELELLRAEELWKRGDLAGTLQEVDRLGRSTTSLGSAVEPYFVEYVGRAYLTLGRIEAAQRRFRTLPDPDRRAYLMAQVALSRGDERAFGRFLSQVDIGSELRANWGDASMLVVAGRTGTRSVPRAVRVARVLEALQRDSPSRSTEELARDFSTASRGELALARGRLDEAIPLLEQGMDRFRQRPVPVFFLIAESLAEAWERKGDMENALQVLEEAQRYNRAAFDDGIFRMRVQLRVAEIDRALERFDEAREVERELRRLLVYADSDHAILKGVERRWETSPDSSPVHPRAERFRRSQRAALPEDAKKNLTNP